MPGEYLVDLFSLSGKGAIVTGAGRGNGLAVAEALLRAGADVLLVDRVEDPLRDVVSRLSMAGLKAHELVADVTAPGAPEEIVNCAEKAFGKVNVLVNNAGITVGGDALQYSHKAWDRTYQVNLRAPFELCQQAGRHMRDRGIAGSIINVTSLNAELAFPDNPAYVAFKGALKQLSKAFALDLGRFGIRVNCIGPGYFRTEMTSASWADPQRREQRTARTVLGRWGEPKDLAGAVVFLASDASAYVTGIDLYVDGGWLIKGL